MKPSILVLALELVAYAASIQAQAPGNSDPDTSLQDQAAKASFIVEHADVPLYPDLARAARLSGVVRIRVDVKNGEAVSTETQSSAHPMLVNAARENIKTWRFLAKNSGSFSVTYVYKLDKEEAGLPENPRVEMQLPILVRITASPVKPTTNYGK